MKIFSRHATALLLCGVSGAVLIPAAAAQAQAAQTAGHAVASSPADPAPSGQPLAGGAPSPDQVNPGGAGTVVQEIVVTGTRASLDRALAIKKDTIGVMDAISA